MELPDNSIVTKTSVADIRLLYGQDSYWKFYTNESVNETVKIDDNLIAGWLKQFEEGNDFIKFLFNLICSGKILMPVEQFLLFLLLSFVQFMGDLLESLKLIPNK
uniref:Uncharacterized protein n=1 Tax=Glossina pallidipes TaxID=7398 RepID=A0A1A9ZXD1_GLOPL